jgi:hypothetical protein
MAILGTRALPDTKKLCAKVKSHGLSWFDMAFVMGKSLCFQFSSYDTIFIFFIFILIWLNKYKIYIFIYKTYGEKVSKNDITLSLGFFGDLTDRSPKVGGVRWIRHGKSDAVYWIMALLTVTYLWAILAIVKEKRGTAFAVAIREKAYRPCKSPSRESAVQGLLQGLCR